MLIIRKDSIQKSIIKDCYSSYVLALFLINLKITSKASLNRYAYMGSPWRAPFSELNVEF